MNAGKIHGARAALLAGLALTLVACESVRQMTSSQPPPATTATATTPAQPLYLCCNIRVETDWLSDGGFLVGRVIPAGTPVQLVETRRGVAYVDIDGKRYRLSNEFGRNAETLEVWLDKVLIKQNPTAKIDSYPQATKDAIRSGKIARGMTREQVIHALGHPPAHANSLLDKTDWTYNYNRWGRYIVQFDPAGRVRDVNAIGGWRDTVMVPESK